MAYPVTCTEEILMILMHPMREVGAASLGLPLDFRVANVAFDCLVGKDSKLNSSYQMSLFQQSTGLVS